VGQYAGRRPLVIELSQHSDIVPAGLWVATRPQMFSRICELVTCRVTMLLMEIFGYPVDVALIVLGLMLIIWGRLRAKTSTIKTDTGTVTIGRDNTGSVVNTTTVHAPEKPHGHILTVLGIVVEIFAIAVTIWHAVHLAHLLEK
jgi:hypothetical protein